MKNIPLDKRVWPGVGIFLAILIANHFFSIPFLSPILWTGLIAHLLFFRDPNRQPNQEGVLAPADGKVIGIDEVFEDRFLHEPAVRIRIFLSIFDVHITRAPLAGIVKYQDYIKGKFYNALRKIAFDYNESNWVGMENHSRRVLIRQMTGAIARRIFSDVKVGDALGRGDKMGMICYGSGVELYIAKRIFQPKTHIGQHVWGGLTSLGAWHDGT